MSLEDDTERQRSNAWSPSLWITVLAWAGLIVMGACVVCVVLTLLGPAIGNNFFNPVDRPYF